MSTLVMIGGSEDRKGECSILEEFISLSGGKNSRIAVMTTASSIAEKLGFDYTNIFYRLGAKDVQVMEIAARDDASRPDVVKQLDETDGIFFTGGDQHRITSLIGGTKFHIKLHERAAQGTVIGGTSAGAAMMASSMIVRGDPNSPARLGCVELGPGMDFMPGVITDTHFSQRGRFGRLLMAVANYPQDLGVGIDEDTALIVRGHEAHVSGRGTVTIVDSAESSFSNIADITPGESLAFYGIRVHILPRGHRFDLDKRVPIVHAASHEVRKRF